MYKCNFLDVPFRLSTPKTTKRGQTLFGSFLTEVPISLGCAISLTGVPISLGCATHHEVRPAKTNKGFAYYFDQSGNAYIWCVVGTNQGMLVLQKPYNKASPCFVATNRGKQWYLRLKNRSGSCYGKNDRGTLYVHRGVAMAFPEICGLPDLFRNQIDHINGDKHDNRACNLRWVTPSENMKAAYALRAKDI